MADRYDPKVTVRPASDRKGSDPRQDPATSDDPLFELARIVSGRGAGAAGAAASPPVPPRGRPAPPPEPARPAGPEPDVLGDLEAELLSDLQASFAAVKEAIEPSRATTQPAPRSTPNAPQSPPSAAAPPPQREPPQVSRPEVAAPTRPAPPQHVAPEPHVAPPPYAPAAFASPTAQQPAYPRASAAARPPVQQMPPHPPSAPAAPPARERPHAPPPQQPAAVPAAPRKVEAGNFNLRPTAAPHVRVTAAPSTPTPEKPAPAATKPSRWEKPAEPPKQQQASAASRFAPPRAANQGHPAPGQPAAPLPADEEELPFGDGPPFAHEGEDAADEFPLDAFDIVPGYGDDAEVPPYPDDDLEVHGKRGVPRSLVAIAGILALVLVGVLGFVMLRPGSGGTGTPPIISADAGPTKISPPEPPSSGDDQQNKLIYDRVDNGAGSGTADTKLVTPGNEPIADVPATDTNNPIARVILPGGPTPEAPGTADAGNSGDGAAAAATNGADSAQSIGPRKVRTVVVRPDGTIVSSDAVPAPGDAPASTDAPPAATVATAPTPPAPTTDDTAAIAGGQSGQELAITTAPGSAAPTPAPVATPEPPAQAQAQAHAPAPPPTPKPTPKVIATGGDGGPIDLTPSNGKSTTEVASGGTGTGTGAVPLVAGGVMVQVSSQRSEDAARATFSDLQKRYPSILGGYDADIQRADLGDRGIYFRVRVGPFASANAQSLCGALKDAGGACVLSAR
jgi:hypothetical protein